jgi:DNA-binding response OmpR family regulator
VARVLVVENDNFLAAILTDVLVDAGHRVEIAGNACDALEWVRAEWPDMIVLDLVLPVVEGWDFIERYRTVAGGKMIPSIVLADRLSRAESAETLAVHRFIPKPFDVDVFMDSVTQILAEQRRE